MPRALLLLCVALAAHAEKRVVFPPGAKPIGPYSPGIFAGDYLYVAGQGARDASGRMPDGIEAQTRQCLDNIKAIVATAGLTMDHVVYSQAYLADLSNYDAMNRVWSQYFPKNPPARATLGVARMPTDTPVEINAVAVRDLATKKAIPAAGSAPYSAVVLTADRVYFSGVGGRDPETGKTPESAAAQVELALSRAQVVLKSAGVSLAHVVFTNVYLDPSVSTGAMNAVYRRYFEFGYTPARATIGVSALPLGTHVEITGVAVRDLRDRRAVRPKNMALSPTASPCVFAGDTLFCSAKSGFIPGVNGGIYAADVENQVRQSMRNLLDGLEEAGLDFSHVVATNVYLDQIDEFANMNRIYGMYFKSAPPARTTVQPLKPVARKQDANGRSPKLEEISLIAVR